MIETIIIPSLEDFKYDDHDREESSGDDLSLEFFDDCFDENLKMDWRIAQRHKRKKECCARWSKQSDGLGRYHTKKTNPCGCPECEKCIPSKINNYRKAVYSKYGPVIYVNYGAKFDVKDIDSIDLAYELRIYWRQVCVDEGKTKVSIQIVNNGIILISRDIEQVKIPEHLIDKEHGITNDDIEVVNVENNHSAIMVNRFDEFAKKCVYFDVQQEIADHWFRKYSGQKKMLHIGREIYKKPKLKIACAELKAKDEAGNMVETHYYAQTCHSEPVSDNEAKYLGTAVYVEIDDPNVFYGLHDGSYLTLEDFVKKIEYNRDNPYVADWFMYFGSGKKSKALLLKLKERYEKKNDDGG
ncbi:MAG TPA: hypothetical protein VIO11_09905 [Candidatus Methanoperedens sp.]